MLLFIILTTIVAPIVYYIVKTQMWINRASKVIKNIPGPKPLPFIGNGLLFTKIKHLQDMFEIIKNLLDEYGEGCGKILRFWIGPKLLVILSEPKHVEAVLSSKLATHKDDVYYFVGMVGNGIIVRNGEEWKEFRKPINKMLATKMIESHLTLFHETAIKFCNILEQMIEFDQIFDVRPIAMNYSIDTLSESLLGHKLNELENNKYNVAEIADGIENILLQFFIKPQYNICQPITPYTTEGRRLLQNGRKFWAVCTDMLSTRKQERKYLRDKGTENEQPKFFADLILNMAEKSGLSKDEIGRLMTDFVGAGIDTTAVTICYTLLMLAMHPEHQEAVYQEQLEIMGNDYKVQPTWEDLSKMTYLTRVVKEVLRLYCPPAIFRKLSGDLHFDEYTLPAGCSVCISLYALQRNNRYWSHPDEFYPDHYLPEEVAKRPKGSSLPFSWGPRSCPEWSNAIKLNINYAPLRAVPGVGGQSAGAIGPLCRRCRREPETPAHVLGAQYGMVSVKTIASTAIRKFKISTHLKFETLEYRHTFIPAPVQGFMITATPRF